MKNQSPDDLPPFDLDMDFQDDQPPAPRRFSYLFFIIIVALLLVWPLWAGFYTDLLWYRELGFQTVFVRTLSTKVILGLVLGLLAAVFVYLNLRLALRLSLPLKVVRRVFNVEGRMMTTPDLSGLMKRLALPGSLVVGIFVGAIGWNAWETYLRYRHRVAFGLTDPIFGRDISFYIFTLPVLEIAANVSFLLIVAGLIGVAATYLTRTAQDLGKGQLRLSLPRGPRAHVLSLLALLFLVFAWEAYLGVPNLLFSNGGVVSGASYSDINAKLPLLKVQTLAALIVAILVVWSIWRSNYRLVWLGIGLYLLVIAGGWIYPGIVQRFSVAPNELAKETPYINHSIASTRKAFNLDRIEERELTGENTLTGKDIEENRLTIRNIRLWDQKPLLDTFAQIQEIRTYYEFQSVDNDRYTIEGELHQVMLSPRELSIESLPNRNWINERLTFTHGFGLTLGPVNEVTPEGLPVLLVKDIPPTTRVPALKIDRPEIYFGEISSDPVYVKTNAREFDYPSGEDNVFRNYEGEGGVSIGSRWRQILFSTRFADLKLMLSNDLTGESRVLFYRDIRERLAKIAPFLRFDSDPYLVISEGRLYWIADAYTTSDRYPYSQSIDGINYIRNSVKAVVDAYHGRVTLYLADQSDPLIQTYAGIFPGILKPIAEMPAGLRDHLRYPEDIFKIQAEIYSTYHMDQTQVFYNKEDQWAAASIAEGAGDELRTIDPYYTIMKLPGQQTEEFILMLPFTPKSKDNLAAWMAARSDGEHYGKLVIYRFPKQKLVFGPKQIVARANQDPEISRQLTLWGQRGSAVTFGNLMVIPIRESLIYVQPLYLRAQTGRIPELRRVIVAAENRLAMEPTLEECLARIFGTSPAPAAAGETLADSSKTPAQPTGAQPSLANQAKEYYERAIQAQREGDWARYGEEIKRLGAVIEKMNKQD